MTQSLALKSIGKFLSSQSTLALVPTQIFDEVGVGAAILLTVAGVIMHWHLPRHRMSMEERVKDGNVTEEEARRQLKFYSWCAPAATMLGVAMLVVVLFDLMG